MMWLRSQREIENVRAQPAVFVESLFARDACGITQGRRARQRAIDETPDLDASSLSRDDNIVVRSFLRSILLFLL